MGIIITQASPLWELFTTIFVIVGIVFLFISLALAPASNELVIYSKELKIVFLLFVLLSLPRSIYQRISIANLEFEAIMWPPEKILLNMILPFVVVVLTILLFYFKAEP